MNIDALPPRLRSKVIVDPDTGCWHFQGCRTSTGYGRVFNGKRTDWAHRVYYSAAHNPLPAGLVLDHLCRVRHCVNPAHLDATTHVINVRRGVSAEVTAQRHASQTHCKRGHPLSGDNIRMTASGRRRCHACQVEHSRNHRKRNQQPDRRKNAVVTPRGTFPSASEAARAHGIAVSVASWRARRQYDGWSYANTPLRCEGV